MNLRDLMISKVRVKLLEIFFADPNEMFYVRDLVRRTNEEINAVRRELLHLEKSGLVKKEPRGNRLYYWLKKDYPFYSDLSSMIAKTTGLGGKIVKNRAKLGRISSVLFSGKFTKRLTKGSQPVDVLIIGEVVLPELAALIREEEKNRDSEINYTVMSLEEFTFRKKRHDPFLMEIIYGPRVMILGQEEDLLLE